MQIEDDKTLFKHRFHDSNYAISEYHMLRLRVLPPSQNNCISGTGHGNQHCMPNYENALAGRRRVRRRHTSTTEGSRERVNRTFWSLPRFLPLFHILLGPHAGQTLQRCNVYGGADAVTCGCSVCHADGIAGLLPYVKVFNYSGKKF